MEVEDKYIKRYWYHIVEDQVYDDYTARGYHVERQFLLGDNNFRADLYATKDDERIIIEITISKKSRYEFIHLLSKAHELGARLEVVSANYKPFSSSIHFDGFEQLFSDYLNDVNPSEFGEFATHNRVDEIEDMEIEEISIDGEEVELKGRCNVELQTWFDHDDPEYTYLVPCRFDVSCELEDGKWKIVDDKRLSFDTSQLDR